jgi:uncharacterized protein (DUF1800 family)
MPQQRTIQATNRRPWASRLTLACAAALLAACGGGGSDTSTAQAADAAEGTARALAATRISGTDGGLLSPLDQVGVARGITRDNANRFLTQASFGPTETERDSVIRLGFSGWITRQLALPATSHRAWWETRDAAIRAADPNASAGQDQVFESFWKQALTGEDQLRQRVVFALSQIFVISALDGNVGNQPRAMAAWLDMLGDKGFTTYRELLEAVSLHPMMGLYLSHLRNQKADLASGRVPDENYGREVMQLLSIGVIKLNQDGTPVLVNGKTVDTYAPADISGMAQVFTGFSWACPAAPASSNCFYNGSSNNVSDPDRYFKPMVAYPQFHTTTAKNFLGVNIPAQNPANPLASLKVALDTLDAHPNTAPFISRQLIQRLVTSNPSPEYVRAVANVFVNNGRGVRGDLKEVVKAILLHPQARQRDEASGKLREPVLRLSAYMRAFPHTSDTGFFRVGNTDAPANSLGQTPLRSPSVFNFYRPGYVAPGTQTAAAGLVAPEMQLLNETSVSGWVNFMRDNLSSGVGQSNGTVNGVVLNRRDLRRDDSTQMALAAQPDALTSHVLDRLLYAQANPALGIEISTAIGKIAIPALTVNGSNQAQVDAAKRNRVNAALLLTLASPEYLAQK